MLSRAFCVGAKDMNTRVYGAERFSNLIIYSLGGHTDAIIGGFFENNSLDVSFKFERCLFRDAAFLKLTAPGSWLNCNPIVPIAIM